jgi:predicted DNA-binding ribbon-helix-helix protein
VPAIVINTARVDVATSSSSDRMDRRQAPRPAVSIRSVRGLDQGQKPKRTGSDESHRVKRKRPADSPRRRSVLTAERKISVSLEDAFWNALKEIAVSKNTSRPKLVEMIDKERCSHPNLSSTIRVFVLDYYCGLGPNPSNPPAHR